MHTFPAVTNIKFTTLSKSLRIKDTLFAFSWLLLQLVFLIYFLL